MVLDDTALGMEIFFEQSILSHQILICSYRIIVHYCCVMVDLFLLISVSVSSSNKAKYLALLPVSTMA